ncbi:TetR family transcriptional regulator [Vagococcus fluvialis]|uniref:TetR/AcrR family transcriptional regulator n=1 Tax=Vagococcus fluvialis TaxID=2738 RepID=A0A369AV44_9ENTE|nr:TetR/AcrR family transcriptional regulator [Vagococcus fluvialis]NKC66631.1 TetR/AcrR family transcriptional regulator [Vagococcus fluvialis]RCX12933.1 TetR family transcriptional regulator [Vagococcus fluvialis]RSU01200.1 hypothetical protein CBF32_08630 [Vagococcus fluvialis]
MEDKQLDILRVATEEFATNGFYKTKTDTIAEKAGVSKGLIFHYFKSKKNLYSEAVFTAIRELERLFDYREFPNDSLIKLFDYSLKRKFEIAETHKFEMNLMLEVYSHLDNLPEGLQQKILAYIETMKIDSYEMIAVIIRQMPVKKGINEEAVVKLILTVFNQIETEAKQEMAGETITDLGFFDELIKEASQQIEILEKGFLRE